MRAKLILAVVLIVGAFLAAIAGWRLQKPRSQPVPAGETSAFVAGAEPAAQGPVLPRATPLPMKGAAPERRPLRSPAPLPAPVPANKAERLAQLRDSFRRLATGDPATAVRAAKALTDPVERETAMLALVTEWKQGQLSSPRGRASAIAEFGLEAGLGLELNDRPDLAVLWANELTSGEGRLAVLRQTALGLLSADPAAAFSLAEQFEPNERRQFLDGVFAGWAQKDTEAAFQWADQLPDESERAAAVRAIQTMAPVGIGAAIGVEEGYPIIRQLVPGAPAELSQQLRPGDRILAIAQGDNSFVEVRGLALAQVVEMIRGTPGSLVQLQVVPGDATPNAPPRTVSVVRGQIKFKAP